MKVFKSLTIIFLTTLLFNCGGSSKQKKNEFSLKTSAQNNAIAYNEVLNFELLNPKNHEIESVTYTLNGKSVSNPISLSNHPLGKYDLVATVNYDGETETVTKPISILNTVAPKVFSFEVVNTYPHDITSYTQGLEFNNGILYESTGQYGESKLRKVDYKTGEVSKNIDLPKEYFGEGLTVLNNKLYLLTWQRGTGFIYNPETLEKESSFKYGASKEGWGFCNDGTILYKSDGTEKIWKLNPDTLAEEGNIQVYTHKGKIGRLNELEWINGKIYANIYQKDGVVIINPKNGATEAVIDFSSLKKKVTQHDKLDVLNGIAYNPETETIFVTGKRWDKLFEVRIIEN
ncbi:glutaminyl-peptide cyclotransferase [Lacinutrix salivirga]